MNTLLIRTITYLSVIASWNSTTWKADSMMMVPPPSDSTASSRKIRFVTNKMCPFAQKIWIALEESQLPYELQEVSLYGPNGKPAWFRELNPAGTVPVLVYHSSTTNKQVVLPDSDLILDHMQQGLVQKGGGEGGASSSLSCEKTNDSQSLQIQSWRKRINDMLPVGKRAVLSGDSTMTAAPLRPLLQEMNQAITGPYLTGEQVTVADCHAFPFLWRLSQDFGMDEYENIQTWLNLCSSRPSFQRTIQTAWWWWW